MGKRLATDNGHKQSSERAVTYKSEVKGGNASEATEVFYWKMI